MLKILHMRSISIKKHEWDSAHILQSIKWDLGDLGNLGSIKILNPQGTPKLNYYLLGPKQLASPNVSKQQKHILRGWNLDNFWYMKIFKHK